MLISWETIKHFIACGKQESGTLTLFRSSEKVASDLGLGGGFPSARLSRNMAEKAMKNKILNPKSTLSVYAHTYGSREICCWFHLKPCVCNMVNAD